MADSFWLSLAEVSRGESFQPGRIPHSIGRVSPFLAIFLSDKKTNSRSLVLRLLHGMISLKIGTEKVASIRDFAHLIVGAWEKENVFGR